MVWQNAATFCDIQVILPLQYKRSNVASPLASCEHAAVLLHRAETKETTAVRFLTAY